MPPTTSLARTLEGLVEDGALEGAVAAVLRGGRTEVVAVGLARDAMFPLASVTKPITSALALVLVEDGVLALEDPIGRWLPELAGPSVMRSARGPVDDLAPAAAPVLVRHLLESTCGWGFPGDLSLPGVEPMLAAVGDGRHRDEVPEPDEWVRRLARVPLLFAPGERWLYDTSYDLLGVLLARAAGMPLPELLDRRLLAPLGMAGTAFAPARFPSGAGGLQGTADDLARFARMLLDDGAPVLSPASVDAMTTDRLTADVRSDAGAYLAGQGWGYGGSVDIAPSEPWHAPGRYGWVGVSGTSLHVRRDRETALALLTRHELRTAADMDLMGAIWAAAAAEDDRV